MVSMRARVRPEQTKRSTERQGARETSKDFLHSGTFWINRSQLKVLSYTADLTLTTQNLHRPLGFKGTAPRKAVITSAPVRVQGPEATHTSNLLGTNSGDSMAPSALRKALHF